MYIIETISGKEKDKKPTKEEIYLQKLLAEKEREIDNLKQLLEDLKTQYKNLKDLFSDIEKEKQNLKKRLSDYEKQEVILNENMIKLQSELEYYKQELDDCKKNFELYQNQKIETNLEEILDEPILALLTPEEIKIYQYRKEKYLKEFELNSSSDIFLLHDTLFHEILHLRLLKRKTQDPKVQLHDEIDECVSRIQKNLEALGMLRKQRLSQKEQAIASLADLVAQFDKEKALHKLKAYEQEEQEEWIKKQERDKLLTDYESAVKMFKETFDKKENEDSLEEDSVDNGHT